VHNNQIPESSGYDAKAEADRAEGKDGAPKEDRGLIDKALHKLGLD
jgi:hypothetical protein